MKHCIFKIVVNIWRLCPFKLQISKIVKKNKSVFHRLYKDLRYKGIMNVTISNSSFKMYNPSYTTIENEIFWKGLENGWEKVSIDLWRNISKDANVILDVGANTGIYSLIAAAVNPQAEIYSFEPVKRTSSIFKKNIDLNSEFNIVLTEKAVSDKNGKAVFYDVPTKSQYSASLNRDMLIDCDNQISYEVDVVELDSFELLSNKQIDLIKLDVEMHEPEAISGMINIIRRDKPTILIEILNDDLAERIENQINDLNYLYYSIDEINQPKRELKLKKSGCYNYLICSKETARKINLDCEI